MPCAASASNAAWLASGKSGGSLLADETWSQSLSVPCMFHNIRRTNPGAAAAT